ncbi:MAG: hypothetical protein H6868_09470 [Rhodospirillales bacterium]|nr:hypothetical protein [Rhodospirillales bacterium]
MTDGYDRYITNVRDAFGAVNDIMHRGMVCELPVAEGVLMGLVEEAPEGLVLKPKDISLIAEIYEHLAFDEEDQPSHPVWQQALPSSHHRL